MDSGFLVGATGFEPATSASRTLFVFNFIKLDKMNVAAYTIN